MSITKLIAEIESHWPDVESQHDEKSISHAMAIDAILQAVKSHTEGMVLVPRERLEKIAGFWDVTMRATDNDMARLMYDASCIAKGMLSIAEEAE